jgi:hypothetical protein
VQVKYQSTHENTSAQMNSALGITRQGFRSAEACHVPWANETPVSEAEENKALAWIIHGGEFRR